MSLLTKMRDYVRVPFVWMGNKIRSFGGRRDEDDPPGSGGAGVHAKLPPRIPVLSGANARAWPPEEEPPPADAIAQ